MHKDMSLGSIGVGTRPAAPVSATKDRREFGLTVYRDVLGWPVGQDAEGLVLRLGYGVGAVELPAGRGGEVIAVLRGRDMLGPVLALPGRRVRWVFLTAPDDPGAAASSAPMAGVRLRTSGPDAVALPPTVTAYGPVRWLVAPPAAGVARLPRLRAVLAAAWQTVTV